ncbi:MAG: NADPH-dependent F420 reductase [Christensenellaceae bacterium]|jgi:NADPH-dependent F420 reductase|nr:NADPH-dependent F420 reductase [Christensenellaceae bacterium]
MKLAVIGGTGDMGYGLALRWAKAGHRVIIGSRALEKAQTAAAAAREATGCGDIVGMTNEDAARACDLAVLAVLSVGHQATVEALRAILAAKPVLDVTIPLAFKPLRYAPPAEGSNALQTKAILGENSLVAAGFHTISAALLTDLTSAITGDVLIVGDEEPKQAALELAKQIGLQAFDAGSLLFSPAVEALTPMLIGMNKRYGSNHIGVRLTGIG